MKQILVVLLMIINFTHPAYSAGWMDKLSGISGGTKGQPQEESVTFPGQVKLTIAYNQATYKYDISLSNTNSADKKLWFSVDSIQSISQFESQSIGLGDKVTRILIEKNGAYEAASNWFSIQSNDSLFLFFKGTNGLESFQFPNHKDTALKFNFSLVKVQNADGTSAFNIIYSIASRDRQVTYLVDYKTGNYWTLTDRFVKLDSKISLSKNSDPDLKIDLNGHTVSLAKTMERPSHQLIRNNSQSTGVTNQFIKEGAALGSLETSGISESLGVPKVTSDQNNSSASDSANKDVPVMPPVQVNLIIENKGEKFQIYSVNKENSGIFVKRVADGVVVKISYQHSLPSSNAATGGFVIQDGILSHPNLIRKVDLEKSSSGEDMFKIESTFSPESLSSDDTNALENKEVLELLKSMTDFRKQSAKKLSPPEKRTRIVNTIVNQISTGDTMTQSLAGSSTDKELILAEIARKIPRTWRALTLSTGVFGDITMVGEKERKAELLRAAIRTTPVVLFSTNLTSLVGYGVAKGSNTDVLQLISPDFSDEGGFMKLITAMDSLEDFKSKVKDPNITSYLSSTPIPDLTEGEIKSFVKRFLNQKWPSIQISDEVLDYLMDQVAKYESTKPEPIRTQGFLDKISAQVKSGTITRQSIQNGLISVLGLSENLVGENNQLKTMDSFRPKTAESVIGHDHILDSVTDGLEIGFANLRDARGAMITEWVEGPPGVGKTELAKGIAKALNVPLGYVDMNNYKPGAATANDFLKEIAKKISNNPNTVLLLDEVEKADPKISEALLRALSDKEFTYVDGEGSDKVERKSTLLNTPVVLTANTIGDVVLEWFYDMIAKDENYKFLSSKDLDKEFKKYLEAQNLKLKDMVTAPTGKNPQGLSAPLVDRSRVHIAYPPGYSALKEILRLKLANIKKITEKNFGIKVSLKSSGVTEDQIIDYYVKVAFEKKWSTRELINENFEPQVNIAIAQIRREGESVYRSTKYYHADPFNRSFNKINQCYRAYLK